MSSPINNEIVLIKARLYEISLLQNEKDALREKLAYLIGKNEGITETEKLIDKKVADAVKIALEQK